MFIAFASCYVSDQDQALAFYERLGFEKSGDRKMGNEFRWLTVVPPGAATGLTLIRNAERAGSGGFVIQVDDINSTFAAWTEIGIEFAEAPKLQPYGMMQAVLNDPDGNMLAIVATPSPRS
jgi:catechol 2,3-dioxygenase-like lactoylglutathione lyase family enzyme